MLIFNPKDHPNTSSCNLYRRNDHDDDIGFHRYPPDDIWRYIEHPDKSEDEIKKNDGVVYFFVSVNKLGPQVSKLSIKESPVIPNIHVIVE